MNAVTVQGIGEVIDGLTTLTLGMLAKPCLEKNVEIPLIEAQRALLTAKTKLAVALAADMDNELNQSGE